jgi:hypothetical protein
MAIEKKLNVLEFFLKIQKRFLLNENFVKFSKPAKLKKINKINKNLKKKHTHTHKNKL